jgi:hypothetical protein
MMASFCWRGRPERGGDSSEVEAESEPWGRARRLRSSPSPRVGRGGDRRPRRGRVRALESGEAEIVVRGEVESEPWGRARRRSSSEARSSPSPGVGRGGDSYGARGWTWLLSVSPWRVAH